MTTNKSKFKENSSKSDELCPAIYSELKKHPEILGEPVGKYIKASEYEDKYLKIDLHINFINKPSRDLQIRAYDEAWDLPGFPIRDTTLKNENELERLESGVMDEVPFVYALATANKSSKYDTNWFFKKIRITMGKDLREAILLKKFSGDRTFGDGNHVTFVDPGKDKTYILRDW